MFERFRWILISLLLTGCASKPIPAPKPALPPPPQGPSAWDSDPRDTLPYLASDELQGRGIGLPGLDWAANFIAKEYAEDGLSPLPGYKNYYQGFDFTIQSGPAAGTSLSVGSRALVMDEDFAPMRFSAQGQFSGPVVFAGYGIVAPEAGYDDYAGLEVKGKIVLIMRYEPADEHGQSRLSTKSDASGWSDHATFAAKVKAASDHGAAAVLFVNPPDNEPDMLLPFSVAYGGATTLPVVQIKEAVADQLLSAGGASDLKSLRQKIDATLTPRSTALSGVTVSGTVRINVLTSRVKNVMGMIHGEGPHANEYVVVGAHYDHLGLGRLGHMLGPVGSIYHGADDNASGTATVLEVATRLAHAPSPARSIVFICFTAEEEGLVGSDYFIKHPPLPLDQCVAMVNLDMVGRIKDDTLYIGGQGTASDFDAVVAKADSDSPLTIKSIGRGGLGPSDHMSFALRKIPVMFFFSGLHMDYHRPTDTADKINYQGIADVADFTTAVVNGLTRMPHDPYNTDADKDSMHLFGSPNFGGGSVRRVILGVIPDYGSQDSHVGVLIAGTTPGTPAEAAGMREGDLLVQFGDQKLENLMDLSEALAKSKPGDKVTVKIIRGSQPISFDVTLAERKG
jgi:hypothetical protein